MRVSDSLRQQISGGAIKDALPSETRLMKIFGVSRSTVGRALRALKAEGIIESVQGSGWYVTGTGDRRPLTERVTILLLEEEFTVGDVFPSESTLCERFGVSRTAVRSAIAQLEGKGLIAMGPGRRRVVRALPDESEDS
ncbi:GntR family transcriptional regulator [Streptomyces sp. YIM 98790]|uniref:GntR family transcriptional regulator n=1 Tax=Streptomyces sp. YIM 98790 TaxID=2689077 RepID=UPI001A9EEB75|nr:GntR family transcriptional regulator [Streptomyces sp. YIM 98790]